MRITEVESFPIELPLESSVSPSNRTPDTGAETIFRPAATVRDVVTEWLTVANHASVYDLSDRPGRGVPIDEDALQRVGDD